DHVALSLRAYRGATKHRSADADGDRGARRRERRTPTRSLDKSNDWRGNGAADSPLVSVDWRRSQCRVARAIGNRSGREGFYLRRAACGERPLSVSNQYERITAVPRKRLG